MAIMRLDYAFVTPRHPPVNGDAIDQYAEYTYLI